MNIWMFDKNSMKHRYLKTRCHLNVEDITDADYVHTKRVCKDFKIKYLSLGFRRILRLVLSKRYIIFS